MKKYTLDAEYDFDFFMIAICSQIKDYRLAWFINKTLEINFEKTDNHCVFIRKADPEPSEFSMYIYNEEENHSQFILLSNHSETGDLLIELKQFDYFIIINGTLFDEQNDSILKAVRSINSVLLVKEIEPSLLKSKNNLIFDI
ncbi:MAG: IPExxxVDY family protein [Bacteroidota bacterium]